MKLTKSQRAELRQKYGGRCAYCGCELSERWHADHLLAVKRELKFVQSDVCGPTRIVASGKLYRPENDSLENMMPSCAPCNIDKHSMPLEDWRIRLAGLLGVLERNQPAFRHAMRFGLLERTDKAIEFYFERVAREAAGPRLQVSATAV